MPTISVNGLRVNYNDTGAGLPIVFVPGLVGSKEWFRYQTTGLSGRYRIISYDLRRARGRADYTMDILVDDLIRFLSALRIPCAVIAGHELGALIGLKLAVDRPDKCLAFVGISAAPSYASLSESELLSHFSPAEIKLESYFVRLWKRITGKADITHIDNEALDYLARHRADIDAATLHDRLRILHKTDLTPILQDVPIPALIVDGSGEKAEILAGSQLMYQCIADSTIEVIEDADHFCFYTRHDLFNSVLDDYLSRKLVYLL